MSAGKFNRSRYETNSGTIHPARIQPETLTLTINGVANAAPAGPISPGVASVKISGGKRQFGVNARKVYLAFTGDLPEGYAGGEVAVPILSPTVFNGISKNQTGTYLGSPVIVVGTSPEKIN
jgi:hypothetical protein